MPRPPTENGNNTPTPVEVPRRVSPEEDDTGRISAMMATMSGSPTPRSEADVFLEAVAVKLASKVGGGGGPPSRRYLGVTKGGWTKMIFAIVVAGLLATGTWVLFVRDDLRILHKEQEHHEVLGHEKTNVAIEQIKEVQIKQGAKIETIDDGVDKIQEKLGAY